MASALVPPAARPPGEGVYSPAWLALEASLRSAAPHVQALVDAGASGGGGGAEDARSALELVIAACARAEAEARALPSKRPAEGPPGGGGQRGLVSFFAPQHTTLRDPPPPPPPADPARAAFEKDLTDALATPAATAVLGVTGGVRHWRDPSIAGVPVPLFALHNHVAALGGFDSVSEKRSWRRVAAGVGIPEQVPNVATKVKSAYTKYLLAYDVLKGRAAAPVLPAAPAAKPDAGVAAGAQQEAPAADARHAAGAAALARAAAAPGGGAAAAEPPPSSSAPPPPPPPPPAASAAVERQTVRCGAAACAQLLSVPRGSLRFKCGSCGALQFVPNS